MKVVSQDGLSIFKISPSKSENGSIFKGKIIKQNVFYQGKYLTTMILGKRLWRETFLGSYDTPVEAGGVTREIVESLHKRSKVYQMPVYEAADFDRTMEDD
jgi:hypothetical protein